jgi:hypothetical protein
LLEPIPALSFIDIAASRAAQPALGGGAPTGANRIGDNCGTEISPDRDTTVHQRDVAGPCASLPTVPLGLAPTLAENPGFSRNEGEIRRETDCLLEGDGFELSVPGRAIRPFGRGEDVFQRSEFAPLAWRDRDFEPPAPSRVDLCVRTRTISGI